MISLSLQNRMRMRMFKIINGQMSEPPSELIAGERCSESHRNRGSQSDRIGPIGQIQLDHISWADTRVQPEGSVHRYLHCSTVRPIVFKVYRATETLA